jgi:hypothetical protein
MGDGLSATHADVQVRRFASRDHWRAGLVAHESSGSVTQSSLFGNSYGLVLPPSTSTIAVEDVLLFDNVYNTIDDSPALGIDEPLDEPIDTSELIDALDP